MIKILISENDFEKLSKVKLKSINESYNKFCKRKKNHLKDPRLKKFFDNCTKDFNPVLYTIPFSCYFSLYLYLYLKSKAVRFNFDMEKNQFQVSKPMEVNFSEIRRIAGIPMGTLKAAYRELIKYGFLVYTEELASDKKNDSKCAMLLNDHYILEHDTAKNKTIFNIKLT
ncbi:MAG: hypothetical protein IPL16_12855 [Ignavibacteria bacterium]|nr:hypothetical protein [Ignavibacteria bacterium]